MLTQLINLSIEDKTRRLFSSHENYLFLFDIISKDELPKCIINIYTNIEDWKFIQEIAPLKFKQLVNVEFGIGNSISSDNTKDLLKYKNSVEKINEAVSITDDNIASFQKKDEYKKTNEKQMNNEVNTTNLKEQKIEEKKEVISISSYSGNFVNTIKEESLVSKNNSQLEQHENKNK